MLHYYADDTSDMTPAGRKAYPTRDCDNKYDENVAVALPNDFLSSESEDPDPLDTPGHALRENNVVPVSTTDTGRERVPDVHTLKTNFKSEHEKSCTITITKLKEDMSREEKEESKGSPRVTSSSFG